MEPCLYDRQRLVRTGNFNFINQSMLTGYSSGPPAGKVPPERFRFSNSLEWISFNIFYKIAEFYNHIRIILLPVHIILPTGGRKRSDHLEPKILNGSLPLFGLPDTLHESQYIGL